MLLAVIVYTTVLTVIDVITLVVSCVCHIISCFSDHRLFFHNVSVHIYWRRPRNKCVSGVFIICQCHISLWFSEKGATNHYPSHIRTNCVPKVSLGLDTSGTDSTCWASSDLWVVVYTISLPPKKPIMQRNDWYLSVSQSNQLSPAYRYKTPQRTDIYGNPSGIGYYTGYAKLWIHSWISHSIVH